MPHFSTTGFHWNAFCSFKVTQAPIERLESRRVGPGAVSKSSASSGKRRLDRIPDTGFDVLDREIVVLGEALLAWLGYGLLERLLGGEYFRHGGSKEALESP